MSTIITGEDYEKYLDHECYMTYVYDDPVPAWQEVIDFLMSSFHEPFSGKIEGGNTLLDIGSGPCIHTFISASNKVNEIYMSDYSQRNIDRLNRWLKGEIDMQTKQIKYVCQLENQGQTVKERVKQIRNKVKQICFIDVTKPGSLRGSNLPKEFDVVTSCWCLESAGQPIESHKTCASHISSLVKKEGYFVLFGNLDCKSYTLENNDFFPTINISEPSLRKIYEDVGFKILLFKPRLFPIEHLKGQDTKLFCMVAQKKL